MPPKRSDWDTSPLFQALVARLKCGRSVSHIIAALPRQAIAGIADASAAHAGAAATACGKCEHRLCCATDPMVAQVEVLAIAAAIRAHLDRASIRLRIAHNLAFPGFNHFCALYKNGRCSVYEHRPLKCTGHHSFDAKACSDLGLNVFDAGQVQVAEALLALLLDACSAAGLPAYPVLLHRGLALALALSDAEARWFRGEDIFAAAKTEVSVMVRYLPVVRDA